VAIKEKSKEGEGSAEQNNNDGEVWYSEEEEYNSDEDPQLQIIAPKKSIIVIEKRDSMCFSTKPVVNCPGSSRASARGSVEKEVEFWCLPRESAQAQQLLRSKHKPADIAINPQDSARIHTEEVIVPKECVVF